MHFDESVIQKVLQAALDAGVDFSEIYVEDKTTTTLDLEDMIVRPPRVGSDCGAGIRAMAGGIAGYAYAEDMSENTLIEAARTAAQLAARNKPSAPVDLKAPRVHIPSGWNPPAELSEGEKRREILLRADDAARSAGPEIRQVSVTLVHFIRRVLVANSRGIVSSDVRETVRLAVRAVAQRGNTLQVGAAGKGAQSGLELFESVSPEDLGRQAGTTAIRMLDAIPAPAGKMPVVIGNGWGGVLIHEACGHCLEGDFIARGISPYAGKVGETVASPLITVVDDGTAAGMSGSYRVDDEGTPAQKTVLIDKGILKGYMLDRTHAEKLGMASTGSARRESFRCTPMVRMRNTYIGRGTTPPEDIISGTRRGLYVARMGGGQADLGRGDFLFSAMEAYMIEDGRITRPVKGATLIGNGFEVLKSIDAVGTDWELTDPGSGACGKIQSAIVCVGQPTIRIPELTVGGTSIS